MTILRQFTESAYLISLHVRLPISQRAQSTGRPYGRRRVSKVEDSAFRGAESNTESVEEWRRVIFGGSRSIEDEWEGGG